MSHSARSPWARCPIRCNGLTRAQNKALAPRANRWVVAMGQGMTLRMELPPSAPQLPFGIA